MDFHTPHALQPFWNIAAAPIQAKALEQALTLGLFNLLHNAADAAAVARQLHTEPSATRVWLDVLWSMDLLSRQNPTDGSGISCYTTSPLARRHFSSGSPENCSQAWLYRARVLALIASQWNDLLQGSASQGSTAPQGSWAQAAREQIGQEQRVVSVPAVLRLIETLPALPKQGRLLDLGGGPGHVAIALAQHLAGWHGVVCDQPETADVARDNIQAAGLAARLDTLGCNLEHDAIGNGYDLIWCSAVLHFLQDPLALLSKACQALNPGGLLLMAHAELSDDPALAARVLPFYGNLALRGHYLPGSGEVGKLMTQAGLSDVQSLGRLDFPMAPVWLYAGRRA